MLWFGIPLLGITRHLHGANKRHVGASRGVVWGEATQSPSLRTTWKPAGKPTSAFGGRCSRPDYKTQVSKILES